MLAFLIKLLCQNKKLHHYFHVDYCNYILFIFKLLCYYLTFILSVINSFSNLKNNSSCITTITVCIIAHTRINAHCQIFSILSKLPILHVLASTPPLIHWWCLEVYSPLSLRREMAIVFVVERSTGKFSGLFWSPPAGNVSDGGNPSHDHKYGKIFIQSLTMMSFLQFQQRTTHYITDVYIMFDWWTKWF